MKSDLHNAATAMEAYYGSNNNSYTGIVPATLLNFGYNQSSGLTLSVDSPDDDSYGLTASAPGGNNTSFSFNSDNGQIYGN